jgi:predicted DNA-binding transcriptional regulator YafY
MNITEKIIAGIVSMQKLKISYTDETETKQYTVLGHLVGKFKSTGNVVLSAYDVTETKPSWKTFILSKITDAELLDEKFEHTAKGYQPNDQRMETIICNIPKIR